MPRRTAVVVIEPRHPQEPEMSVAEQIHRVVIGFRDEPHADRWIDKEMDRDAVAAEHAPAPGRFEYYITDYEQVNGDV